ncbi:hypothetical protein H8356DRAFT_1051829 [Neocallimastix lanati (nom. inval.)]|nr:hypothetical protein H8356DRAFT_1051829 [Neocallimastix sp. JGI-2020a]
MVRYIWYGNYYFLHLTYLTPIVKTETYYLYNVKKKKKKKKIIKAYVSDGILGSPITLAYCDVILFSLWDILCIHNHFHLKINDKYCLMVVDNASLVCFS